MSTKLLDLAKVLRSKNSGPFQVTLDILFDNKESYNRVVKADVINEKTIMKLYHLEKEDICCIVFFEKAMGIKVTYNRKIASGGCFDRDVYGAQQQAPLFDLEIE